MQMHALCVPPTFCLSLQMLPSRQALLQKIIRDVGTMDVPTPPANLSLATPLPEAIADVAAMIVERQMLTFMQVCANARGEFRVLIGSQLQVMLCWC